MKNKSLETILYSSVGVAAMALILIAFNFISGSVKERVDLTKEKAYTLSAGTRAILAKLDAPVKVRFYCTQGENSSPQAIMLKNYAKEVEDLLGEYKQAAKGKLIIEKYNPEPDSDAEDSAHIDGIEGQVIGNNIFGGERFYLGLAISYGMDQKVAIPALSPERERLLEYDISRAISQVFTPEKPVVGIMSPLPVFGAPANPMMARMGQQQGEQPWVIVNELKNDFKVKRVGMDVDKIDDEIKVLLVIHPREITEKAQYALDQFVLRGGKMLAFLDPLPALIDVKEQNQMFGAMPNTGSNLDKLLKAWGLTLESGKVVADMKYKLQVGGRNGQPTEAPAILGLTKQALNNEDIITSQLENVWLPFAGSFSGTPAEGLKETVLLKSTKESQLVDGFMANLAGENIIKEFKPSGTEYALAVRLTGKFKTAFPNGKPEEKKDEDKKDGDKKDDKAAEKKSDNSLKEGKENNSVILVGDADMLSDRVALQPVQNIFGGTTYAPLNGNFGFCQNAVEQMAGDNNLINVRSRATTDRPLTKVKDMEAVAQERFQAEIKRLGENRQEAQRKINELQQAKKDKDQRFILSPEQQAELVNLRKQEADSAKHLRQVEKDLHKEVVSLQTRVKWINVLVVPIAVALSGVVLAGVKSRKTSAK